MSESTRNINSTGLIHFIHKWRYVLITTTVLALISSTVFSLFIEDKYSSSVILFPSTTSSISEALLSENNYGDANFLEFGEEEEADQMIQILSSDKIRNHIIQKFDLFTHYDIDQSSKYSFTKLINKYDDNIDFYRTKYLSVKIEVLDKDPNYASEIANEIVLMYDSVKNKMQKKVALQAYHIVKEEHDLLKSQLRKMEDTLDKLRNKGVHDYSAQVEMLTEQLGAAIVENNNAAVNDISNRLDSLSKYGGKYLSLSIQLEYDRRKYSDLKVKLAEARVNAFTTLDQYFVVNEARPAEKPNYPIRWLIVLVFTIITFLFTLILLILMDNKQHK